VVLRHVIQHLKLEFSKILPDRGFDLGVSNSKLFKIVGVYRSDKCICRISICFRWSTSNRRAGVVLLTCSMPWAWRMRTSWICSLHGWGNNFVKRLTHGWWYHKWGNIIPIVGAVVVRHSKLKPTKSVAGEDYVPNNRQTWDEVVSVRIDEEVPLSGCNQTALGVGLSSFWVYMGTVP